MVARKEKLKLVCSFCGEAFETYPSRADRTLCSRGCPGPEFGSWSRDRAYLVGLIAADGTDAYRLADYVWGNRAFCLQRKRPEMEDER